MKETVTPQINKEHPKELINNPAEAVFVFDIDIRKIVDFNEKVRSFFKYTEADLYDTDPFDLSPEIVYNSPATPTFQGYTDIALKGGNPLFKWIYLDRNGQEIPCEIRLSRFPPYHRQLLRATVTPTSDRDQLEAELKEKKERLKLALSATKAGCFDWNLVTGESIWDKKMHEIFGRPMDSTIDHNDFFYSVLHPEDLDNVVRDYQENLKTQMGGKTSYSNEYRIIRAGKVCHIIVNGYLIRNPEGVIQGVIGTCYEITEIRNREAKLKFTTGKLNDAQKLAKVGSFEALHTTNAVWWSEGMYHIFEIALEDPIIPFQRFQEFCHPEDWSRVEAYINTSISQGIEGRYEYRLVLSNNRIKHIDVFIRPIKDAAGKVIGLMGTLQDITDRKVAEAAYQESEKRFKSIFQQQFQFMAILSPEGKVLEVNNTPTHSGEYNQEDYLGKLFWEATPWENLLGWQKVIKKRVFNAAKSDKAFLYEDTFQAKNGNARHVEASYTPIHDSTKKLLFILVQANDITEQRQAEKKLKGTQEKLSIATERLQISTKAAKVGIWEWVPETDEVIWDDIMFQLYGILKFGFSRTSTSWQKTVHPDDLQQVIHQMALALKGEKELNTEFRIIWPDQSIHYIKAIATVHRDANGRGFRMIGTNWDITKEKEAERQKIWNRQLEIKNEELEQFAYVASHDLKEPLRTVKGFSELLKKRYHDKLDGDANNYLNFISQAASRMDKLIKALLEYSQLGRNKKLTEIDCDVLIKEIQADLSAQIEEVNVRFDISQLPIINGSDAEIRVLFQNLISNAIKFRKKETPPLIQIHVEKKKNSWFFCISDNGIGIAPEYKDKIFVIFQRLHNRDEYEGTGIGLAHCQKIVEIHGGKIWMESELGVGSSFYFSIPDYDRMLK